MRALAVALVVVAGCRAPLAASDPRLFIPRGDVPLGLSRATVGAEVWIERDGEAAPAMHPEQSLRTPAATLPPSERAPVEIQVWVPDDPLPIRMKTQ